MNAMRPFLDLIFDLEGFELVAFWLFLFIGYLMVGFFLDSIMARQGFGPFINGALALVGAFLGLYLRYNYFMREPWYHFEPFTTSGLMFGSVAALLLTMSFLRNRFY